MKLEQVFSTTSAKIQIGGQDIGLIQDLKIEENFNTTRLKSLWARQNVGFIAGTEDIEVSASKAFVEMDSILYVPDFWSGIISKLASSTGIPGLGSLPVQIGQQLTPLINSTALGSLTQFGSLSSVGNFFTASNAAVTVNQLISLALNGIINGSLSLGTLFAIGDWDIVIQGPAVGAETFQSTSPGSLVETDYGPTDTTTADLIDVFRLKDCRLVARSMEMSTGNIVVMEQVTAYVQDWSESYMKYVSQPNVLSKGISSLL